jgi:hypothetical protein
MKKSTIEKQRLINAQKNLRRLKIFYIHLAGYIVFVALILYNFYIIEDGPYKNSIISLNLSLLVAWSIFILIHGLNVFKGQKIFKKSWEDRKIKGYLKEKGEEKTTFWE